MIRLLIVDDEPASIRVAQKILEPLSDRFAEILTAENGVEALRHIESGTPPQIVITDMDMPVLNGISLLEYLTENRPEIFTIVASGYYDYKYTHAAIKAKSIDYLLKPLDRQQLTNAVLGAISQIDEKQGTVDAGSEAPAKIPQDTYHRLLRHTRKLRQELQNADGGALHAQLDADCDFVRTEIADCGLYPFVYKIYSDALVQFYIEHEYPVPGIPAPQKDSFADAAALFASVTQLYDECLAYILRQKRHSSSGENLERINRYIYNHYRENISLADIADTFYINKVYLSSLFREKYGETVGQMVTRLKIADAKRQLRYSDRSIAEIAESLGYQDPVYFNKQFKKETGMPPGQFRKEK